MHCNEPPVFYYNNQEAEIANSWQTEGINRIILPVKLCINKEKSFL